MKIEGTKTEEVIIEISDKERKQIVVDFLTEKFNLNSSHHDGWISLENGKILDNWEEGGGNHSWFTHKVLRKATKGDKVVLDILHMIGETK